MELSCWRATTIFSVTTMLSAAECVSLCRKSLWSSISVEWSLISCGRGHPFVFAGTVHEPVARHLTGWHGFICARSKLEHVEVQQTSGMSPVWEVFLRDFWWETSQKGCKQQEDITQIGRMGSSAVTSGTSYSHSLSALGSQLNQTAFHTE